MLNGNAGNNLPVDMSSEKAVMLSSMLKIAWLVLLMYLHFSNGSDPQPEQIHLSSTGNSSFKYIREGISCELKQDGNHECDVKIMISFSSTPVGKFCWIWNRKSVAARR